MPSDLFYTAEKITQQTNNQRTHTINTTAKPYDNSSLLTINPTSNYRLCTCHSWNLILTGSDYNQIIKTYIAYVFGQSTPLFFHIFQTVYQCRVQNMNNNYWYTWGLYRLLHNMKNIIFKNIISLFNNIVSVKISIETGAKQSLFNEIKIYNLLESKKFIETTCRCILAATYDILEKLSK